jgi:hypothetical protein
MQSSSGGLYEGEENRREMTMYIDEVRSITNPQLYSSLLEILK